MFFVFEVIFFFCLFMIVYIYMGYPVLIYFAAIFRNRRIKKGSYEPHVTILVAAYNEEKTIAETLENKLALDYPKEKLEIIVISDGSTDGTDQIVKKYEGQCVKFFRQEPRAGKTSALNMAVPKASGDILVFSDANSIYARDALRMLVANFNDPSVGYVTGKMIYTNTDGTIAGNGCTSYMKYENRLRSLETKLGSVVGVDGGIDAIRKVLYRPMNPDQLPDFVLPLRIVEQGYRVVYEPGAILQEASLKSSKDEYMMRVRVSLRALWALNDMRHLLSLKKFKIFAWQLWSHKVLRYLCFVFLIGAYLANFILWGESGLYKLLFLFQNMGYLSALVSTIIEKKGYHIHLLYLINYFVLLNLAAAHAFIKFLLGHKQVVWTPRKG
jgi:cellulose synthase/poly-beta-1,6-N-acetylglucosamine synthase-like glycosyltransferase